LAIVTGGALHEDKSLGSASFVGEHSGKLHDIDGRFCRRFDSIRLGSAA
jgi:hypothetical protein